MSANKYDAGDVVRLRGSFTNSAGTAVDPASVVFQYRLQRAWLPASYAELVYGVNSVVKAATGEYYHDFAVSSAMAGERVQYRWEGQGANAAAGADFFQVRTRWSV